MTDSAATLEDWFAASPGMVRQAVSEGGRVVEQAVLAQATYRLRIAAPRLSRRIRPGQFFMLRFPDRDDPLLGRPFALYDVARDAAAQPVAVDFVYHVVGKTTGLLSRAAVGDAVEVWGPLGNGFPVVSVEHLICVGGGIGYTPFLAVAREAAGQGTYGLPPRLWASPPRRITLCYGVRTRAQRADLADFAGIPGLDVRLATDDGSEGRRGFVTDLLRELLDAPADARAVFCCGPEPMMHATARLCAARGVPCWLSLETPMACGFGACFSCVTKVRTPEPPGWDYRRTCVEGPVFDARVLMLDETGPPIALPGTIP